MTKVYLYVGFVLSILSGFSWFLYSWHYSVLDGLNDTIKKQEITIDAQDVTINNLGVEITKMINENKITGFEEYFKGYGDANTSIDTTKLIF